MAKKKATVKKAATKSPVKKSVKLTTDKPPATKKEAAARTRETLREGSRSSTVVAKRGNRKFQPITEPMEKADISRGRQKSTRDDEPHKTTRHKKQPHQRRAAMRD
jgi:hypothetical protein